MKSNIIFSRIHYYQIWIDMCDVTVPTTTPQAAGRSYAIGENGATSRGHGQHGIAPRPRISAFTSQSLFLFFFSKEPPDVLSIDIQRGPAERFSAKRR